MHEGIEQWHKHQLHKKIDVFDETVCDLLSMHPIIQDRFYDVKAHQYFPVNTSQE